MYMEPKNHLKHILATVVMLLPLLYLGVIWNTIPGTIALHFDASGTPDRYGDKLEMLALLAFTTAVTVGSYFLVINAHKTKPLGLRRSKYAHMDNIAMAVAVFVTIINIAIIFNCIHPELPLLGRLVLPAIALMFIVLGNLMYNIKPNLFVGIRLPWTLASEDNWRKTHQVGSRLFFVGGILMLIAALTFPTEVASMFLLGLTLLILVVVSGYSYDLHRKALKK